MKNRNRDSSNRGQRLSRSKRLSGVVAEIVEQRLLLSTYTVNTTSDATNPGAGLLTLRQAVANANNNHGADSIAFDPTVFAPGALHTITLTQGEITFTDTTGETTVNGPGSAVLAVSGNGASRVFQINSQATTAMSGLQVVDGNQTAADSNDNTYGGGIYNIGTLTLTNSTVSGNSVVGSGKYDYDVEGTAGMALGGGIYSTGNLTITGTTLSDNSVTNTAADIVFRQRTSSGAAYGGAIYSNGITLLIDDTIKDNSLRGSTAVNSTTQHEAGGPVAGGGIYVSAALTVNACNITGNTSTAGLAVAYGGENGGDATGGGVFAGSSLIVTNSVVENNSIQAGHSSFDDGFSGIVLGGGIDAEGTASISGTTISNNKAIAGDSDSADGISAGGGLYAASNATLTTDTINGNTLQGGPGDPFTPPVVDPLGIATAGGGVYGGGTLTISNTSVSGNSVTSSLEEGVSEFRPGGLNAGGGIAVTALSTITGTTISNNSVTGGKGYDSGIFSDYDPSAGGDGHGGGIFTSSSLVVTNSTIAANRVAGGIGGDGNPNDDGSNALGQPGGDGTGGGIYSLGALALLDSTVTGNITAGAAGGTSGQSYDPPGAAGIAGGAGIDISTGMAIFANSIISADMSEGKFDDIDGSISSKSANNLIGVGGGLTNGVNGNKIGINNPMLSLLGNNGGPTHTMVPLPGSPAIDAGNNSLIPPGLTTDQRGLPRIVGKSVDIGATEFQASIFGTVFDDFNGNGKQDPSESGVPGVTVYIDTTNSGALKSGDPKTTTNSSGNYSFTGLVAGTYIVRQIRPTGDNQISPANNFGNHVTVAAGQTVSAINFADQGPVIALNSVSGTLFNDTNKNGKQDSNETGLSGWTVFGDLNNNGKIDPGEASTTTGPTGQFFFAGLVPGAYIFRVIPPSGWTQTFPTSSFGQHLTVSSSTAINNINFGFAQTTTPASISGSVFNDANGNGIQNSGELGLSGWTVFIDLTNSGTLQNADPTTTTDSTGNFTFTNLAAGTYIVRVIAPTGWSQTLPTKNFGQHITLATGQKVNAVLFGEKRN